MDIKRISANIDLGALENNIKEIKKVLPRRTKIVGVVKADAYGHGSVMVSKVLNKNGVDWLATATIDEAIELRKAGIYSRIIVLSPVHKDYFDLLFDYDITPAVFCLDIAKQLNEMAIERHAQLKVHIKLDTGMSRIGFLCNEECIEEIVKVSELSNIVIEGIFTHYANSDTGDRAYTDMQMERYNYMVNALKERGIEIHVHHTGNSAAIMQYPETHTELVRAGIIMYGMQPSDEMDKEILNLKPLLSLKSHVAFVKEVEAGVAISYGSTYVTERKTKIATIPVGYADGYPRLLSNKGRVIVNGEYAPILGRVCMDQMMVDITDIPDVEIGDEVTLIGKMGDKFIPTEEVAEYSGTINYEIVCGISKRVPRIYERDGKVVDINGYFNLL